MKSSRGRRVAALSLCAAACAACDLEGTKPVPGPTTRFDPVSAAPRVAAFAGDGAALVRLEARFVREDGTQDLEADYVGHATAAEYVFSRLAATGGGPPAPLGASPARSPRDSVTVTIQRPAWVHVHRIGGGSEVEGNFKHLGMERTESGESSAADSVPLPSCSFADLWRVARRHDAPAGAVAHITYDKAGYTFTIDGTPLTIQLDMSCRLKE
jgi:hypothetical protein